MIFLLVTLISMLISVFLVFKLIKYMGIKLYFKPLLLCALCAAAFNYLLPWVAIYAANYQFPILLSTILAAAYAITVYQQRLAAKAADAPTETALANDIAISAAQLSEAPISTSPIMTALSESVGNIDEAVFKDRNRPSAGSAQNNLPASPAITEAAPVSSAVSAVGFSLPPAQAASPRTIAASAVSSTAAAVPAEFPAVIEETVPVELPVPKPKLYLIKTPEHTKTEPANTKADSSVIQKAIPAQEPITPKASAKPVFPKLDSAEKVRLNNLTDLDELLDNGFTALNAHNYASAVFAYKRALLLFSNDDYAPFIVIELGNIFKTTGFYDKAAMVYQQAFTLPSIAADEVMQKEFAQNIKYLSLLQQHLKAENQENTPFADISSELLDKTETAFQAWRNQNS